MGNLISMTDANGNTTNYEYDLRDRLTRETKPDGGVINYEYDAAGNRTAVTDADGNSTTFTYDSINRLIKTTDPEGDTTNYTFDTENNMASMIIKDNLNNIIISESYSYDDHNRLTRTTHADGTYTEQSYDALGNVLTKRDENGNATTNAYDALNRLISVTDPDSGVTSYTYDKRNNLTSITDANGNVTTYHYDNLNRLISTTSPDTGTTTYTYDTHGNMITKTDANGVTTTYSYDSLDRQTAIQFPDSTQNVTYAFDNCLNGKGRVCMMTDPSGIAWYDYDKMGRVVKESKEINSINYQTDYSYDFNGNVSTITYPGGREIAYTYNQLNKIVSVAETYLGVTRTVVSNIDYQPFGDITSMSYGNGIVTLKTYDNTNRLNSLNVGTLKQLSYVRDNTGNITAITDGLNPVKKRSFTYDLLNRLTFAAGPWGALTYAYDPVGNRTYETTGTGNTTYSYTANKLTAAAGEKVLNFNYDNNGNTTAENNKQYSYNQNQRLTQVTDTSTVLGEYGYNAKSQRIKKSVNGQTTIFHYDQNGLLIAESTVTGEMIAEYVYLNGQPLARMGSGIFSDADGDGVGDAYDNCIEAANPDQRDTNSHEDDNTSLPGIQHYGNICDPDFDNNGFVNILDFNGWRKWARSSAPPAPADIDVDGNGTVWIGDFNIWRRYYGKAPGPGRDSTESNRIYYYHNDHLGTPMMMTDGSGSTVWQGEFKPLGEPVSISGSITNNLRFPGQYYDVETGLHQNWHRDYMPEVGRYVESDPILQPMIDFDVVPNSSSCSQSKQTWQVPNLLSTPQGLQPYVYTANNPINFVDPSGLWTIPGTNWCGPGGSGHLTGCYDKACKAHDKCYEKCALDAKSRWKDGNIFSKCAWECDKKLVKRWKNCACSGASGNW
ncbi:MAG: RHS domain-containing protein [Nitrospirae bacterium]|nr:RHS domain-containing protein [Nitrospirota bacterium]